MKIEDLEEYITNDGFFYSYTEVHKLYNFQQSIIDSLVSNSESQAETNRVLAQRKIYDIDWIENEIELREKELDNYSECNANELSYAQGVIEGLQIALDKLR